MLVLTNSLVACIFFAFKQFKWQKTGVQGLPRLPNNKNLFVKQHKGFKPPVNVKDQQLCHVPFYPMQTNRFNYQEALKINSADPLLVYTTQLLHFFVGQILNERSAFHVKLS